MLKQVGAVALAASLALGGVAMAGEKDRGSDIQVRRIADGSQWGRLTFVTHAPGDFNRLFIVEKPGRIFIYNIKTGSLNASPFLNITGLVNDGGNEQGLLGLAFHPDYQNNGYFYVNYTDNSGDTEIRRFSRDGNDPDSATQTGSLRLMNINQPFSNHNGGWIEFGPDDGYLYIATGDGGAFCDPSERAQNLSSLLGKILRIDVDGDDFPGDSNRNYAIPADNPFVGTAGSDEVYLWGLRNPYRCGFDSQTGDLFMADVGQDAQEEISWQSGNSAGGENYGWDCREGDGPSSAPNSNCSDVDCSNGPFVEPIYTLSHLSPDGGGFVCSIISGVVYRGCALPGETGNYFFTDYCQNIFRSLKYDGTNVTDLADRTADLAPDVGTLGSVVGFGEDAFGAGIAVAYDLETSTATDLDTTYALEEVFAVRR